MTRRLWTNLEILKLKQQLQTCARIKQISISGRTTVAIVAKMKRLGLKSPNTHTGLKDSKSRSYKNEWARRNRQKLKSIT